MQWGEVATTSRNPNSWKFALLVSASSSKSPDSPNRSTSLPQHTSSFPRVV